MRFIVDLAAAKSFAQKHAENVVNVLHSTDTERREALLETAKANLKTEMGIKIQIMRLSGANAVDVQEFVDAVQIAWHDMIDEMS
jgi:hypothetical protein